MKDKKNSHPKREKKQNINKGIGKPEKFFKGDRVMMLERVEQ